MNFAKENTVEIAVIILTINQKAKVLRCLSSFRNVIQPPHKIIVWDNGSQDGTLEAVKERFPDVITHHHPENIGVASGRNAATKLALEKFLPTYLFFLDNDMTVTPDFLANLQEPFFRDNRIAQTTGKIKDINDPRRLYGAGGCRINFWLGDTRHRGYGELDQGQHDKPRKCIPSGGCMLVRTDIFKQLGGFDPIFDPYGPEDLDFGLRMVKTGHYGWYTPDSIVYHDTRPGRTFEAGQYTEKFAFHRVQNWCIFMGRHATIGQKFGFFLAGIPTLLTGFVIRQTRRGSLLASLKALLQGTFGFLKLSLRPKR